MPKIIDISVGLQPQTSVWRGSESFKLFQAMRLDNGDEANVSKLETDVHVGTHVDAPWHFVTDGSTVEQLSLDVLMGVTTVVHLPNITSVTAEDLESLGLLIDEAALVAALKSGKVAGAALDVFEVEPLPMDRSLRQ